LNRPEKCPRCKGRMVRKRYRHNFDQADGASCIECGCITWEPTGGRCILLPAELAPLKPNTWGTK